MFNYCPYSLIVSHLDQHDLGGTSTFVTYKTERYVRVTKEITINKTQYFSTLENTFI